MAKDDVITMEGRVSDCLPSAKFKVTLDTGIELTCHLSGKMRKNNIRVLMGDRVSVEVSTYDLTQGRISYRHK